MPMRAATGCEFRRRGRGGGGASLCGTVNKMLGNDDRLIELCWNVVVVWECALRDRPRSSFGELGDLMQGLLDSEPLLVRYIG